MISTINYFIVCVEGVKIFPLCLLAVLDGANPSNFWIFCKIRIQNINNIQDYFKLGLKNNNKEKIKLKAVFNIIIYITKFKSFKVINFIALDRPSPFKSTIS